MTLYDKEGIKIYNQDSLITMESLLQDNIKVDCIVTDPPYPITARGTRGTTGGMLTKDINLKGKVFDHNNCDVKDWMPKCYELLKDGGHAYFMTNHKNLIEYLNTAESLGFSFIKSLIWDKCNKIMGRFYMSQYEYILFFRKGEGIQINNCGTSDIISIPNKKLKDENGKNYHDTEKPVELMKILVENSTKENELVLDPFVGIGATPIACKETNRRFIGGEIDENYFNVAVNRLDNTKLSNNIKRKGLF